MDKKWNLWDVVDEIKMILTGRGHFPKNRKIGSMVNELNKKYRYSRDDLADYIIAYYFSRNLESRYDKSRSSFELYLVGICFYWLKNFLAKCRRSELSEQDTVRIDDSDRVSESILLSGCLNPFENSSQADPETLYCALELMNIIEIYYDEVDMAVARKEMTCEQAAREKGVGRECYKKRYQRKTTALIEHLNREGWIIKN